MARGGKIQSGNRLPVFVGMALVVLSALLQLLRPAPIEQLGLLLFDSYQRAAPRAYEDAPVRIVDIDDESIRRLGQWPWPRTDIARLIDRLGQAGASVVVFDVVFSEPDRTSPGQLASRLESSGADRAVIGRLRGLPDNDATLAQSIASVPTVLGYFLLNDRAGPPVVTKAGFAVGGSPPRDVPEFSKRFVVVYTTSGRMVRACGSNENGEFCIHEMSDGFGIYRLLKPSLEEFLQSPFALEYGEDEDGEGAVEYWHSWEVATKWVEITAPD